METSTVSMPPSVQKKRRRPALACEQCRRRKVRCDRNLPCNTCVRSKNALCTYTSQAKAHSKRSPKHGDAPPTGSVITALSLPEPILPAFQPLPTPRHSNPSTVRTDGDLPYRKRLADLGDNPVHGSAASNEAGLSFPEPILPIVQSLPTPKHPAAPAARPNADSLEGNPLFLPTPSSGQHSGPAEFGTWQPLNPTRSSAAASIRADSESTPGSCHGSSSTVNSLTERVRQLEQQLSDIAVRSEGREEEVLRNGPTLQHGLRYSRGCVSKTRYFGQSHWMNAADMVWLLPLFLFSSLFLPSSLSTSATIFSCSIVFTLSPYSCAHCLSNISLIISVVSLIISLLPLLSTHQYVQLYLFGCHNPRVSLHGPANTHISCTALLASQENLRARDHPSFTKSWKNAKSSDVSSKHAEHHLSAPFPLEKVCHREK